MYLFCVFMQQIHDSNWVPFFTETFTEADLLAKELIKTKEYTAYYIGEVLTFSHDFHSKEIEMEK